MFDPVVNSFAPHAKICFLIICVVVNCRVTCWSCRWLFWSSRPMPSQRCSSAVNSTLWLALEGVCADLV
jgi:hypothetical protein